MKSLSLPKACLLRAPWEFRQVYDQGRRIRGPQLTIIYTPNGGEENRLGISVHGIKTAVRRNRIKRIIREYFRHHRHFISPPADIVFAVRGGFAPDSPAEVRELVELMLQRAPSEHPKRVKD